MTAGTATSKNTATASASGPVSALSACSPAGPALWVCAAATAPHRTAHGFVAALDREDESLQVNFDGRAVSYPLSELDELSLCYATTIHKSQGSEYPVVIIPLSTQHYMMLRRNLIYTGVTRGKRLVVLVGQKRALGMAIRDRQTRPRCSKLRERLAELPR